MWEPSGLELAESTGMKKIRSYPIDPYINAPINKRPVYTPPTYKRLERLKAKLLISGLVSIAAFSVATMFSQSTVTYAITIITAAIISWFCIEVHG